MPDAILEKISKLPESIRSEYLKDCLQETRFSYFESSGFLIQLSGHPDYLSELQEKYSRFLVYSAREWFASIPFIQCVKNPFLERYLRLALSELMKRNIIQETEGWNYYLIRTALILWALSPVVPRGGSVASWPLEFPYAGRRPRCIYCEEGRPCMAKDKSKCHHKRFSCLVEAGIHLCKNHGEIIFLEDRTLDASVPLEDGRTALAVGRADFIDRYGMKLRDREKIAVCLNEFGEYRVVGCPRFHLDWFMDEPDDLDEIELRVRTSLRDSLPPQTFWDF